MSAANPVDAAMANPIATVKTNIAAFFIMSPSFSGEIQPGLPPGQRSVVTDIGHAIIRFIALSPLLSGGLVLYCCWITIDGRKNENPNFYK